MNETTQRTAGAFVLPAPQYDKTACMNVVNELREKYSDEIDLRLANWIEDLNNELPGSNLSPDPISQERWRIIFIKMSLFMDNLDNAPAKVTQHKLICDTLTSIYRQKNHDYGDSFAKVREVVHNSVLVRLMDKLERLKTLMKHDAEPALVIDENVDDTLMDLANYCIMELIERQIERQELNEKVKERLNEKTESEPQEEPPKPWE